MILRACIRCGTPSPESYCPEHKLAPWQSSRRRELMGMSGGAWDTLRRKVLARDQRCCYLCDQAGGEQLEVDHLIPVTEGGGNELTNLATCHASCHARRHREPEWARARVEMALKVLSATPHPAPIPEFATFVGDRGGAAGAPGRSTRSDL